MSPLKVTDFDYYLPPELIAQEPLKDRDSSRLLVLNRETGEVRHRVFTDIKDYLTPGDALVINNTKVLPARLYGKKKDTGARIEVVLLKKVGHDIWEVLVKPGKRAGAGTVIVFGDGLLEAEVLEATEVGGRILKFFYKGIFEEILDRIGQMPLPPYIKSKLEDKNRYQTVYAREEGSAAAPTAGLHFTPGLLGEIEDMGVKIVPVTLHVGLGTFRPVKVLNIEEHKMHAEYYEVSPSAAETINNTRDKGGRIIAVGTTTTRTLETLGQKGRIEPGRGWTDIFIYPGYNFKMVEGLVTNFHLPKSTLLMLVSAFAGREKIMNAYREAIKEKYRFFSFGDAMLII